MALFGGKANLQDLLRKVQKHDYASNIELEDLLEQIQERSELKPRMLLALLGDSTPRVREWSADLLRALAMEKTNAMLLEAMATVDARLRRDLAREVAKASIPELMQVLGPMVHSRIVAEREAALEVVSSHAQWLEFMGFLKAGLRDSDTKVRQKAVRILRRGTDNPTVRLVLLALIHDEDREVRCEVIAAMASDPGPDIVEPFFARLPFEEYEEQRFIVDALSKFASDPRANLEEHLVPVLGNEDPKLREIAVKILASMPSRKQVLRAFLIHSRGLATWLRERTTASILNISSDLVEPLLELMGDPDEDIQVGAMLMAANSDDMRIIEPIKRIFLGESDWWVRSIAADVLVKFPASEVIDILLERIDDRDLRHSVVSALGNLSDERVIHVLVQVLSDPSRSIRIAALTSLSKSQEPQVAQLFAEVAKQDPEQTVRDKATVLLEEFGTNAQGLLRDVEAYDKARRDQAAAMPIELEMANDDLNKKG